MSLKDEPICNFCGHTKKEVKNFVEGQNNVMICETCIIAAKQIIENARTAKDNDINFKLTPREIYEKLDEYVIGQDRAKRIIATEVREHYKRISAPKTNYVELEKSNILLIGPTGVGKTLIMKSVAKVLNVPFAIGDATTFTQAGYVGNDVESVLTTLIINADFDIKKAERGIVFIDEIDKCSRKGESPSLTRDVSGEGVQQALLKMIEGSECIIPADGSTRKHPHQQSIAFDTTNVLFVFGGSFEGLSDIIRKRVSVGSSIGFNGTVATKSEKADINTYLHLVTTDDLIKFGLIPELLGRIPIHVTLDELNKDHLKRVLVEPKNSLIKQLQYSFELDNAELKFSDECIDLIVERAIKKKTGARGLRSIVKDLVMDIQFEIPETTNKNLTIDRDMAKKIFDKLDERESVVL